MTEGECVSHYRIIELLGGGGMGVVYKAHDTKLQRTVALKFLPAQLTRDHEAKQRLVQEARAASALDDVNICTVHDIDQTDDGRLFLVMAFYEGETLKTRIARGMLEVDDALGIAKQIVHGLAKAHENGIIHRDIKPANVIVTKDGVVKILDFGVAKLSDGTAALTQTGMTLGTVAYMAPEQLRGDAIDQRADLWALGAVFHEMLSGRRAFLPDHDVALVHAILHEQPAHLTALNPKVPKQVATLVDRLMQKQREARYPSATALLADLEELDASARLPTRAPGLRHTLRQPRFLAPAAVVLAIVTSAAIWRWNSGAEQRWAEREALPEIRRLIDANRRGAAYELALRAERSLGAGSALGELWSEISRIVSFTVVPAGAAVGFKPGCVPR